MRVYEVAREFDIEAEKLITLLRSLGVRAQSEASKVDDAIVAKLRARFERERRAGHGEAEESIEVVMEEAQTAGRRRRRRHPGRSAVHADARRDAARLGPAPPLTFRRAQRGVGSGRPGCSPPRRSP